MDVKVGPHWYRNSNGTVEIEGLPQLELELRKTGGVPIRVNFAIFDSRREAPCQDRSQFPRDQ